MVDLLLVIAILGAILIGLLVGFLVGCKLTSLAMETEIAERVQLGREDALKRQCSVLGGKLAERLAPYLPEFVYDPTELRFIGDPIDFVLFRWLAWNITSI